MNSTWKKVIAGVLSAGLLLGCCSCGSTTPEDTTPVIQANIPETTTFDAQDTEPTVTTPSSQEPLPTVTPTLPLPPETTPTVYPTLPLPPETTPTVYPTLPLPPEETDSVTPTLPLPQETIPVTTTPPPQTTAPDSFHTMDIIPNGITSPHLLNLPNLTAAPKYPVQAKCPDPEYYAGSEGALYDAQQQWRWQVYNEQVKSPDNAHDLDPFLSAAVAQYLSGSSNQVCAPMNIYFALAMLAETTAGSSRQQILNRLGHSSIESLRAQAKPLWLAHYYDNGKTTSLMANSVWLDNGYHFNHSTLSTLSKEYFSSVFTGDLGSADMNRQLSTWLNSQTGGLLSDYTQNVQLDPATVFSLASTAYFSADWEKTFSTSATKKGVFHGNGYDISTDFMHKTYIDRSYYVDPSFSAISLELSHGHKMWLILPDEGFSPEDLLKQGNYYNLISAPRDWAEQGRYKVNLSMPKFDVSSEQDLCDGLKAMGITDVFHVRKANFSPITDTGLFLGEISHAARVAVDEEGVIAAAYTIIQAPGSAMPPKNEEIDFILDRPFLFFITSRDNLPLFAGTVHNP